MEFYLSGGTREALYSNPDEEVLDLKRKLGFLELCMRYNVPVVPCYTFNEVDHFSQISYWKLQEKQPFIMSLRVQFQYTFGIMFPFLKNIFPRSISGSGKGDVVTVVGKPLHLPHITNPSSNDLQNAMNTYTVALLDLYNTHAPVYSSQSRRLVIT